MHKPGPKQNAKRALGLSRGGQAEHVLWFSKSTNSHGCSLAASVAQWPSSPAGRWTPYGFLQRQNKTDQSPAANTYLNLGALVQLWAPLICVVDTFSISQLACLLICLRSCWGLMMKCWSTIHCSTSHIFRSQFDFPCALVQILSRTTLQQSLIWTKKQFYFFTLSPSVKCISCWFLTASFSKTASRNIKSLSAEKKSFTFFSCQWQITIFLFILLSGSLIYAVFQGIRWC